MGFHNLLTHLRVHRAADCASARRDRQADAHGPDIITIPLDAGYYTGVITGCLCDSHGRLSLRIGLRKRLLVVAWIPAAACPWRNPKSDRITLRLSFDSVSRGCAKCAQRLKRCTVRLSAAANIKPTPLELAILHSGEPNTDAARAKGERGASVGGQAPAHGHRPTAAFDHFGLDELDSLTNIAGAHGSTAS